MRTIIGMLELREPATTSQRAYSIGLYGKHITTRILNQWRIEWRIG
jgi:hypothetical protein